jgi:uncharacterized protein YndB with AHSA1/START domain
MEVSMKTQIQRVTGENQLRITRQFDAPVDQVWKAWTTSELLDQWWAPKPWKTRTRSLDFSEGGKWMYAMVGPEGEEHLCRVDYIQIVPGKKFTGTDAFCDAEGNISTEFPTMHWICEFEAEGDKTNVLVTITFGSEEDLNKIVEMGFKEGFTAAHDNLDELLAR